MNLTIDNFREACQRIQPYINRTPLRESPEISSFLNIGNIRVYLKEENLQKTRTFKVRGAYNSLLQLSAEERIRGIVTRSSGNFAQAVAQAAKTLGINATIVMPNNVPEIKLRLTNEYGPEIIFSGPLHEEGDAIVAKLAAERKLTRVHPYNQREVIIGQGTLAMEVYDDLPSVKHFFCPVGGGGLMGGCATALKLQNKEIQTVGVEPAGADDYCQSRKLGKRVVLEKVDTIADGLRASEVGTLNRPLLDKYVDIMESVPDESIRKAMQFAREHLGLIVEPSGATALAALLYNPHKLTGDTVCIISGANIDPSL